MKKKLYIDSVFIFSFCFLFLSGCAKDTLYSSKSIADFLDEHGLEYEVEDDGDFRILKNNSLLDTDVWIRNDVNQSGESTIREIFSAAALVDQERLTQISPVLLSDNFQTRVMGGWAVLHDEDEEHYLILYVIKAALNAEDEYIIRALLESSDAASTLSNVLFQ